MTDITSAEAIQAGRTALGIEFGSTQIKSVLIDENHRVLATGAFQWENRLGNGLWTYHLEDAIRGLQESFADLAGKVRKQYGQTLTTIGAIGISGMMHGYLPLSGEGLQLAPFLTWRNTNTTAAANALTKLFQFNIPLRWSISQLYQAILEEEPHVEQLRHITTLAGYIHYLLTGCHVLGIGEASGMFPVDPDIANYHTGMLAQFSELIAPKGYPWTIQTLLPKILLAGEDAGHLTREGALLLDPTGTLHPGIPLVPPEGDAGTGMVATNSVAACTGNVSAGTSIFAMVVLERPLSQMYRDIDIVATPTGKPVAMVHCNNGTSELDAWMRMFGELLESAGMESDELYGTLFQKSLEADLECGGMVLYNYISGEPVTGLTDGRPLIVRRKDSKLTLPNFMRAQIYSVMAALTVGMRVLAGEQVMVKRLTGHGGLFKTPGVAQRYLAAAMDAPVTVMQTAGEGGPYGMALLAAYSLWSDGITLEDYLEQAVFADAQGVTIPPDPEEAAGYAAFIKNYCTCLPLEYTAVDCLK